MADQQPINFDHLFNDTPAPEESNDGFWDKVRKIGAIGTRGVSGLGASILSDVPGIGTLTGAGVAGAGEALAETIEGSPLSGKRIATEAALGAVPMGKLFKAGQAAKSALMGGALAGVGTGARQLANDEDLNIGEIGSSAIFGGTIAGGLARLFGGAKKAVPAAIRQAGGWSEPTTAVATEAEKRFPLPNKQTFASNPKGPNVSSSVRQALEENFGFEGDPHSRPVSREGISRGKEFERLSDATGRDFDKTKSTLQDQFGNAMAGANVKFADRVTKAKLADDTQSMKNVEDWIAKKAIAKAKEGGVETVGTPRESYSSKIPGGKESVSVSYPQPEPDLSDVDDISNLLNGGKGKGAASRVINQDVQDAWLKVGATPENAAKNASQGIGPRPYIPAEGTFTSEAIPSAVEDLAGLEDTKSGVEGLKDFLTQTADSPAPTKAGRVAKSASQRFNDKVGKIVEGAGPLSEGQAAQATPELPEAFKPFANVDEVATRPPVEDVLSSNLEELGTSGGHGLGLDTPQADPLNLYKSRVDASGEHYRGLSKLLRGQPVDKESALFKGTRTAGRALAREGKEAGLPPTPRSPVTASLPQTLAEARNPNPDVPAGSSSIDEVQNLVANQPTGDETPQSTIDRLKQLFGGEGHGGGQKGEIPIGLLTHLGSSAAGGLVGYATDPLDNPLASAGAGMAVGFAAPSAIKKLAEFGANPSTLQNMDLSSPEAIKSKAKEIWEALPQIQRFNYLSGGHPIIANAFFGPYGSAVMSAIEHGLSGDPRGWEALDRLKNPAVFLQEMLSGENFKEAAGLIGRAEGTALSENPSSLDYLLHAPGTTMTAGDLAARKNLEAASFTGDEARRITMTGEPETKAMRSVAEFGKQSPLLQLLFPFRRTPANILEQGAQRIPGLGSIVQSQREIPDSLRQQLVQQGLGAAVGVGSGVLGANVDPETGKTLRRYVSNAAGQYSLPASMGFAAGQAMQKGKSPVLAAATEGINDIPLPATDNLTQWVQFLTGNSKSVPGGLAPAFLRDLLTEEKPKQFTFDHLFDTTK